MKQKLFSITLLVIGIVLVINFLSNELHVRLDLTDDRQYTLSQATRDILDNLEEPVTIKAYFSQDLPPNIQQTRNEFRDLLVEYNSRSNGMIAYEFINPNENEGTERLALENGIQPVMINVREKDQVKQQKAFLGATLNLGEKVDVIPFVQPGSAMEYALSTSIKRISVENKPVVGFVTGHGEPALPEIGQAMELLSVLYTPQEVNLDSADVPAAIRTLALIRPLDSIPAAHLQRLDAFLARGGRLLMALNRVNGDLQRSFGMAVSNGLEGWLAQKGLSVDDSFIIDAKCGAVTVQQQQGMFNFQTQVSFPYLPVVGRFADHPITKGLETVLLQFASPVNFIGDSSKRFTPLIYTSERSATQRAPFMFDINKQWTEQDFPERNIVMGGMVEDQSGSRIIVFGDGDFLINGPREQARTLQPDNVSLAVNAIDWLSDDTGLIDLRTKGATSRPIMQLEEGPKAAIKYLNFLLPILLVIAYGGVRWNRNRMTRLKRMSDNYETN